MAKHNYAIGTNFNDNNGHLGWFWHSEGSEDLIRLYKKHGKIGARIRLLKQFWRGVKNWESSMPVLAKINEMEKS
jgi:hypothetical protein